jgi:hypothetical protein
MNDLLKEIRDSPEATANLVWVRLVKELEGTRQEDLQRVIVGHGPLSDLA